MASQGSYTRTKASVEVLERNVHLVRRVFHQVWTEFYANKPKINKDLTRGKSINIAETSIRGAQAARHAQLREKYADHANVIPKILPSVGVAKLGPAVGVEYKGRNRSNVTSKPRHSARAAPITSCPKYWFCSPTDKSAKVWHDFTMPYIPMMDDSEVAKYGDTYKYRLSELEVDTILFETVHRLQEEGLSEHEIDNTRLLPTRCSEILFYDLTRELPAFPKIGRNGEKEWRRQPPVPKSEPHGREATDLTETFCPRPECGMGCHRHIADAKFDIMQPRRPAMATHKDLVIPTEPCSDQCVFHLNRSELEISDSQESRGTKFTRDQLNQLLALLPALEMTGSSYCDAALVFAGPTCQDVARELRGWRTKIMLKEDSKPIMDDHGQLVRIAPDQEEQPPTEPEIPIDFSVPNVGYCTHLGPCDAKCRCSGLESSCELTCHCDASCPRRWKGCKCHSDPSNIGKKCLPGRCECLLNNRECDPGVCRCEPPRPKQIPDGKERKKPICQNMGTREVDRPKTIVRVSKIEGAAYGLFALEPIRKGKVIDEYVGEIVDSKELDRRAIVYATIDRNYAYDLGTSAYLDAFNYGNHTRFFNGTVAEKANVHAVTLNVCGEPRILISALRPIKRGEEMLLYYGETFGGGGGGRGGTKKTPPKAKSRPADFDDTPIKPPGKKVKTARQSRGVHERIPSDSGSEYMTE